MIPLRQPVLVEDVETPRRHPGEVQRGRAGPAHVASTRQHARKQRRLQLALGGEVGEARAHECASERRGRADAQRAAVERAAAAAQGAELLAVQRIVHDRDQRAGGVATGDGHGPLRDPVEEVDRPVERVDDPFEPARARRSRTLLAEHAVAGPLGVQQADDQRLGIPVGIGDRVGLRALVVEAGSRPVVALDEQRAGRPGGPLGEVEQGVRIGGRQEWRGPDLNRRHPGFQPSALPAELPRRGPHQATTGRKAARQSHPAVAGRVLRLVDERHGHLRGDGHGADLHGRRGLAAWPRRRLRRT